VPRDFKASGVNSSANGRTLWAKAGQQQACKEHIPEFNQVWGIMKSSKAKVPEERYSGITGYSSCVRISGANEHRMRRERVEIHTGAAFMCQLLTNCYSGEADDIVNCTIGRLSSNCPALNYPECFSAQLQEVEIG